jgi:biotin operon repressor
MAQAVDEKQLQKLLAEGVSQREIARRLNIPRASLQRHIKALGQAPAATVSIASNAGGIPIVDADKLTPEEIELVRGDFWELITWWRERRLQRVYESTPRETQRQTYHVEKPFIRMIHREAESEGVSITEVVNRAFRDYFEKR